MKTTAFLICYVGMLISVDVLGSEDEKVSSRFPLFMLPSFTLPYLQKLGSRQNPPERILATKTEYMEVTRRQTVHPICYTAYEAKAPCLSYGQSGFQYDDYETFEFDSVHEAHESFDLNSVRNSIQPTPTAQITPTPVPELVRSGKYLELKLRRNHEEPVVTSSRFEGSDFFASALVAPPQPTDYLTKTVLITKLEKYTDRRVTATLLALNCLPTDRSIPVCQSPIREAPDRRLDVQPEIDSHQVVPLEKEDTKSTETYPEEANDSS